MKKLVTLCLALLVLTSCGSKTEEKAEVKPEEKKTLTVSTWGLSQDTLEAEVFGPFEKDANCDIVLDLGNANDRYTKFSSNANSGIDVIELSQIAASKGQEAGLFEEIDYSKLSNAKDLLEALKPLVDAKQGPAYTINSLVIVVDPEKCTTEITDYADLWKAELANSIAIPDITSTFGPHTVYVAKDFNKGNDPFEALAALKPNIVKSYSKSSDIANMFTNKEVSVALVGDFALPLILAGNPNVKVIFPTSGAYANFNTININKNSANKELAYKYIDYRISQTLQTITAAKMNEAPTNTTVKLEGEVAQNKTYGEHATNLKTLDFTEVNKVLPEWIDSWNRVVNN